MGRVGDANLLRQIHDLYRQQGTAPDMVKVENLRRSLRQQLRSAPPDDAREIKDALALQF